MHPRYHKTWETVKNNYSQFYIDDVVNDTEGTFVTLHSINTDEKITIIFDGSLFSCKGTRRNYHPYQSIKTGIYEKEDSQYLTWLSEESDGVYENEYNKMIHYIFVGYDLVFEILALAPPKVQTTL